MTGRRHLRSYWLLIAFPVAFLAVFFIWPLGEVLVLSATDPALGVGNYVSILTQDRFHRLIWTTIRISAITAVITVLLAYIVAYVLCHVGHRLLTVMLTAILIPFWLSIVVRAFSWIVFLRSNGVVNEALRALDLITAPLPIMRNEFGVLVGMVHFMLPIAILLLHGNMRGVDNRLVLAAKGLGASSWFAFRTVYLPQTFPGIFGAVAIVLILSLGFFTTPALLGGGKTVMIAEYISDQVLRAARWGIPAALATLLLVAISATLLLLSQTINLRRTLFAP